MAKKVNITIPNIDNLGIEVKLYGDWVKVDSVVTGVAKSIQKGYDISIDRFSKRLLRIVKTSIATGIPPRGSGVYWEPLSRATIDKYGEHPIYYLTGLYHKSVGLFKYKSRTLVGLPIGKSRLSSGGITLNQLAIILEYGTGGYGSGGSSGTIPPRPLWAPSLIAMGGKEYLRKLILTNIRKQLRTDFSIKANQVRW